MSVVIKAEDLFDKLPEKEKQIIRKRADELYAEISKDVSMSFCRPRRAAPKDRNESDLAETLKAEAVLSRLRELKAPKGGGKTKPRTRKPSPK
jgi:hypothetical protein